MTVNYVIISKAFRGITLSLKQTACYNPALTEKEKTFSKFKPAATVLPLPLSVNCPSNSLIFLSHLAVLTFLSGSFGPGALEFFFFI